MTPEARHRLAQVFDAARELPTASRAAYLDRECAGDPEMRRKIAELLAHDQAPDDFLDRPAWEGIPPETISEGVLLGPYRLESLLGAGGMGEVYRAWDSRLDRMVAIKLVRSQLAGHADLRERFQREARALAQLNHPNICTIHDIGPDFLVMEWIQGKTLKEMIATGPLSVEEALDIVTQAGRGLQAAHERGILHRDIKPANIMVTPQGQVKVMDFGLAKFRAAAETDATITLGLTDAGVAMGTPPYMSPEQARGGATDQRADLWSLGVVLYETVTGGRPFQGPNALSVMRSIVEDEPQPPSTRLAGLPPELDLPVARALAKAPGERYQSAADMISDLQAVREGKAPAPKLATAPAVSSPAATVVPESTRSPRPIRGVALKIAAGLFALLAVGYLAWRGMPGAGSAPRIQALAVLPLANLSGDPAQEFFADGMTDALTSGLAQIGALRVISRTSVMQFKGTKKLLPEIARELRVDAVVEGSVLRSGNRVRITAELVDASTDRQLWSRTYERNLVDILDLQNEVSRAIAGEIQAKVTPQEQVRLAARSRTINPAAYEALLKCRYSWNALTEDALFTSVEYCEQAIKLDPEYPAAYASLSISLRALQYIGAAPSDEVHPRALAAATKALQLDDELAEAHVAMGAVRDQEWDWAAEERELKRAFELNPGYAQAHQQYSDALRRQGRAEESIAEAKRALDLDPLSAPTNEILGDAYRSARQYDQAIQQYLKALELHPEQSSTRNSLGWCYVYKGMYDQGIQQIQKSYEEDPSTSPELAYIFGIRGQKDKAREILGRFQSLAKSSPVDPGQFVLIYAGLGDKDQALAWLERAYREHSQIMTWLRVDPRFDSLRPDARFQDLIRRVGLR